MLVFYAQGSDSESMLLIQKPLQINKNVTYFVQNPARALLFIHE